MKRPIPVTLISIFFSLIALLQLSGLVAGVMAGTLTLELLSLGVSGLVSVLAVVFTWRLKRASLYCFATMFVLGLLYYTGITAPARPMTLVDVINWAVLISVIIYLCFLLKKGVLKP